MTTDDQDRGDLQRVAMMLEASGLTPGEDELRQLAAAYADHRRLIELLYDLASDDEQPPG